MTKSWPFFAKFTLLILLIYLLLYGFYIGQHVLLPLGFAFLFSVLLRPLEKRLLKWKVPKVLSIVITIVIGISCLAALIMFLSHQISSFVRDVPAVKANLANLWDQIQQWALKTFHISEEQQQNLINKAAKDTMSNIKPVSTIGAITTSLANLVVIPVYIFLFLYYRAHLLRFVSEIFGEKHSDRVGDVISQIRYVMQHYITGLLTETTIVGILNVLGLILIGAPYALLLGVIAAILNLIPYIGGLIAVFLTALITYTNTGSVTKLVWSVVVFLIVQLIDNNFLVPRVIASKVKLNALISIIGVLVGGALCGVGGMFLSLPLIAVCKVVFDRVDELKPWGKLLGDDIPSANFAKILPKKRKPKVAN